MYWASSYFIEIISMSPEIQVAASRFYLLFDVLRQLHLAPNRVTQRETVEQEMTTMAASLNSHGAEVHWVPPQHVFESHRPVITNASGAPVLPMHGRLDVERQLSALIA
ncbi:hypothetical protein [Luteibacter sp. CQ10]|uniref:hypothetical protein n=1 Tax=Luteibacter sp. CQ10 TaxID=2805821 RepID=UPI0034A1805D